MSMAPGPSSSAPALEIYEDEEFASDDPGPGGAAASSSLPPAGIHNLHHLAPYAVSRKENLDRPTAWAGTALEQKAEFAIPAAAKLEILADDEFDDEKDGPPQLKQGLDAGHGSAGAADQSAPAEPTAAGAVTWPAASPSMDRVPRLLACERFLFVSVKS